MKILYIYRSKDAGPSIRRVFEPIEKKMSETDDVSSIYLPCSKAGVKDIIQNIVFVKKYLTGREFDIIHITGDVYYLAWLLPKKKTIVTVHDLVFFTTQKRSLKTLIFWLLWVLPLRRVSAVTFISQKSLNEAQSLIKLSSDRVFVINNPYGQEFEYSQKELNTDVPEILHIGTKSNKNLERVAEALKDFSCRLHVIGELTQAQKDLLEEYHIDFYNEAHVSDHEILEAYKSCDIVSFPSLYEGFGMPIIEGQAVGRPVVTSDLSPMKEVSNGSAVLVSPTDCASIRNGFFLASRDYRNIVIKGLENVKRFSLSSIVAEYRQLYMN